MKNTQLVTAYKTQHDLLNLISGLFHVQRLIIGNQTPMKQAPAPKQPSREFNVALLKQHKRMLTAHVAEPKHVAKADKGMDKVKFAFIKKHALAC